jgi:putative peptide zinc metalloprotease protein
MYAEIEICETDFKDKYLIKKGDKSMYVGHIVRDIIELLKQGRSSTEIHLALSGRHSEKIDIETINEIVEDKIEGFLTPDKGRSFFKVAKLFNPAVLTISGKLLALFQPAIFYTILSVAAVINICIYLFSFRYTITTMAEGILVYLLLFVVLIAHELGHAIAARRYNTVTREIGLGLYYVMPVFYVDLNEVWKLDKKKRILINFSGIFSQLVIGVFIFLLSWVFKGAETVLMSLFMVNFIVIILNLNPFLKFDGYWILSDLLGENNLDKSANEITKHIFRPKAYHGKNPLLVIFSISRLCFIAWIFFIITRSAYMSVSKIINGVQIHWYNYIPVVIFLFIFCKIFLNFLKRKNELRKRKKDL